MPARINLHSGFISVIFIVSRPSSLECVPKIIVTTIQIHLLKFCLSTICVRFIDIAVKLHRSSGAPVQRLHADYGVE